MTHLPTGIDARALGIAAVLAAPRRFGSEIHFPVQLQDGRNAVLAQLAHELAADDAVRRHYRRDVEALFGIQNQGFAPIVAWGPPLDDGSAPWRLRVEPPGESLESVLRSRGTLTFGEISPILTALCNTLSALHERGLVIRDLTPARIRMETTGPVLVDVGLARVDLLSTRTAASLVLEGSPYAAPELLMATEVDGRADVYALGVLAYRMLTGQFPHGDGHALLRPNREPTPPSAIVPQIHADVDTLILRMVSADPNQRPPGVRALSALLRGETALPHLSLAPVKCQACSATLPAGMRLCLQCGLEAVQFIHAPDTVADRDRFKLVLKKVDPDAERMILLRELCGELCEGRVPALNFKTEFAAMYSKGELKDRIALPATLFTDLDHATGLRLETLFRDRGFNVQLKPFRRSDGKGAKPGLTDSMKFGLASAVAVGGFVFFHVANSLNFDPMFIAFSLIGSGIAAAVSVQQMRVRRADHLLRWGRSLLQLRQGPTATSASDPLVRRLTEVLRKANKADLRQLLGTAAMRVQGLVDHRTANLKRSTEIDMVTAPVAELVKVIEARAQQIIGIDQALADLDEGDMVRELYKSRARNEPKLQQENTLMRLDRMRELEIERTMAFTSLLEGVELMRRSVELGMRVQDPEAEHERCIRAALSVMENPVVVP